MPRNRRRQPRHRSLVSRWLKINRKRIQRRLRNQRLNRRTKKMMRRLSFSSREKLEMRRKILLGFISCCFSIIAFSALTIEISAQSKKDLRKAEKLTAEGNKAF